MKVSISRKEQFNAAHRLFNPEWSDDKNDAVYGKCNNPNYHGHNYTLIVTLIGEIDPETGYVFDLKILSDIIRIKVVARFDHKNLNLDTEEFRNLIPTSENFAVVIYDILRDEIDKKLEIKITLYETERNYVEFPA